MVARATGRSPPFACARHAPSRHRRKDLPDASVAHWGALPWPTPVGSGQHAIAVSIAPVGRQRVVHTFRAPIDSVLNFL